MLLSRETVEGLYITGKCTRIFFLCTVKWLMFLVKSFVELSRKLPANPELKGKYILSDNFCQDLLENYFGQQRSCGGWSQNPTISACISSAQSIRVQGSQAMVPVRGNSSRKRRILKDKNDVIDSTPLQKRKRRKQT